MKWPARLLRRQPYLSGQVHGSGRTECPESYFLNDGRLDYDGLKTSAALLWPHLLSNATHQSSRLYGPSVVVDAPLFHFNCLHLFGSISVNSASAEGYHWCQDLTIGFAIRFSC